MFTRILFTISILTAILAGCKTVQTTAPTESYVNETIKAPLSNIAIPFDLGIAELEQAVNRELVGLLYADTSYTDNNNDNLKMQVFKSGNMNLRLTGNELAWELPLRLDINYGFNIKKLGMTFSDYRDYKGEIILKYRTKININEDWRLRTTTTTDGYTWVKSPTISIAGFDLPITVIANILLKSNSKTLEKSIDEAVASSIDMKKYAQMVVEMTQKAIKIPADYNLWVQFTPETVSSLPIAGANGRLVYKAAIAGRLNCYMDSVPLPQTNTALPILKITDKIDNDFNVNLLTNLPYPSIERITKQILKDTTIVMGNRKIKINDIRIYGSNKKMVIETDVSGSIRGKLYFTGIPTFNPTDTSLRIKDLQFDIKTRNIVIGSASWLFNGKIEQAIQSSMIIPIGNNIRTIETQLNNYIREVDLGHGFAIQGNLSKITVSDIILTNQSVKANVVFGGNLKAALLPPKQ